MSELLKWRGNPKRCGRRSSFATRGLAIQVATGAMVRKRKKDPSYQMTVYCCIWCKQWHLVRCKRSAADIPEELRVSVSIRRTSVRVEITWTGFQAAVQ
jgi:hypothetical protein